MEQQTEQLFTWLDTTTNMIVEKEDVPYLEALIAASELLFYRDLPEDLDEDYEKRLTEQLNQAQLNEYPLEARRKAMQLAILKGMKGSTQQHHYITPDTIGMFMGYLLQRFMGDTNKFSVFDPACGSANLLISVINQLENKQIKAYGSEVDPTLIRLAYSNTNLQEREIEYFHQDSLKPILLEPVDTVVSDLPVGFYPDDDTASAYDLKAEEGHSFAHHLFIEQSLKYTKEGGYLFFVVPSSLFESEQKDQLQQFLKQHAHIVGLLQLPETMFKHEQMRKSIFVLQKKGENTRDPRKVLLADLPSFKDVQAMDSILMQINQWFENER
ncbi:class I SAM-dependent methyltransferase [Aquisalibacillus elongatus]|uniref:Site-specific DNA-methyltransferase (Adenine-specific) n=1 Tax=Aquisalibacillus elongatus TaxID=485577 RepID=A0A3N5BJ80_9BACI|nr:class I SAM-dependent methyltransferase [Aquisalibacillus elongatus]RPF55350.1 site-specific DNA-methyltransferase (adenine-specific) [Aquisalibacillus elongatus]